MLILIPRHHQLITPADDALPDLPDLQEDQLVVPTTTTMPLLSQAIYYSLEELQASINTHARQYRFAFTKDRSTSTNKTGRRTITFYYDRYSSIPAGILLILIIFNFRVWI